MNLNQVGCILYRLVVSFIILWSKWNLQNDFDSLNSSLNNINHVIRCMWVLLSPNSSKQPPRSPQIKPTLGPKWKFNHQQTIKNHIIYLRIYISRFNNCRNGIDKPPLSRSFPFIGFLLVANKHGCGGSSHSPILFNIKTMFVGSGLWWWEGEEIRRNDN